MNIAAASQLVRYPDWDRRLRLAIEAARTKRFCWGTHDCCLFAADLVEAMTGSDPAAQFRGAYSSEHEAMRKIRAQGGIEAIISKMLGTDPCRPTNAQRGDILLMRPVSPQQMQMLGVCVGDSAVVVGETGILHPPISRATKAWRLG